MNLARFWSLAANKRVWACVALATRYSTPGRPSMTGIRISSLRAMCLISEALLCVACRAPVRASLDPVRSQTDQFTQRPFTDQPAAALDRVEIEPDPMRSGAMYLPTDDPNRPRVRYVDGQVALNRSCMVRVENKLSRAVPPMYVNGQALGFC